MLAARIPMKPNGSIEKAAIEAAFLQARFI
jgi:hypothetical protein